MSRKITSVVIATAVAVSFLFVGVGAVAAHDNGETVGASGHCSDDSNGGGGSVGASEGGSVDGTGPDEAQSTAEGLAFYAQQKNDHPDRNDTCDGGEGEDSYDYLEVHASDFQVCYSEDNAGQNGGYATDGSDACH